MLSSDHEITKPTLRVDLGALQRNWQKLKSMSSKAQCAGVVKANGYGLGLEEVGCALQEVGCQNFFVATVPEAVRLRFALKEDANIYVLGGVTQTDLDHFVHQHLIPVLSTTEQVDLWLELGAGRPCGIHIDTGMNRLGLNVGEYEKFCESPEKSNALNSVLVISHLVAAQDPHAPENRDQLLKFCRVVSNAKNVWPDAVMSLANSSGIFLGPDWHFDMLRPGVALYGVNPVPGKPNPMEPVVSLVAPVMQERRVDEHGAVGYDGSYFVETGARLATVAVGYADGYPRALSNLGTGWIGGRRVPIAGKVSMDMTTFDLSSVQENIEGAVIELIGDHILIDELADDAGTIAYELLVSLGRRFDRRFVR